MKIQNLENLPHKFMYDGINSPYKNKDAINHNAQSRNEMQRYKPTTSGINIRALSGFEFPRPRAKVEPNGLKHLASLSASRLVCFQDATNVREHLAIDNATALVFPFGAWSSEGRATSLFYSFGRSVGSSSRFG
ncbi:unnamed protein product [Cyprideis torosa]|uniref:Uncharacterized protein n=1 Tax=Cyprideis torosa TaxID=163714 RepID=A0A7R8WGV9_9CRUS|nr:unnamed protein product [Cyprideis torosa]CAG0897078.1 unnamed protein product [Cyprideis torosa]